MSKLKYKGTSLNSVKDIAEAVSYDNTESKLTANNLQNAIDELNGIKVDTTTYNTKMADVDSNISQLNTHLTDYIAYNVESLPLSNYFDAGAITVTRCGRVVNVIFNIHLKTTLPTNARYRISDQATYKGSAARTCLALNNECKFTLTLDSGFIYIQPYLSNLQADSWIFEELTYITND